MTLNLYIEYFAKRCSPKVKFCLLLVLMLLNLSKGNGQDLFTVSEFLAGAIGQEAVIFQSQKLDFFNKTANDLLLIEKLEFRTETNEFDFKQQEYLLRISPNSLKRIKTQRQYQQSIKYETEMELEAAWGKAFRERYDLMVNYIYFKEILAIKNKHKVLLGDRATLLKRSVSLPNFDILELIDSEDQVQENIRDILDLENAILTLERVIQRINKTSTLPIIDKEKLLEVNDLKKALNEFIPNETGNHPDLKVLSAQIYNSSLEHEWEMSKSKFSIGYIQGKYGYDLEDNFRKSFSIGIGFDIPLKGQARLDNIDLRIKTLEAESDYLNAKNQLIDKKYSLYQQLQSSIVQYELVSQQLNDSQAEFALQEYSKIAEVSPKAMLKLRENTLKKELLLKEMKLDIIQTFIEYVDIAGLLSQKPFRNYLSKDLDRL